MFLTSHNFYQVSPVTICQRKYVLFFLREIINDFRLKRLTNIEKSAASNNAVCAFFEELCEINHIYELRLISLTFRGLLLFKLQCIKSTTYIFLSYICTPHGSGFGDLSEIYRYYVKQMPCYLSLPIGKWFIFSLIIIIYKNVIKI